MATLRALPSLSALRALPSLSALRALPSLSALRPSPQPPVSVSRAPGTTFCRARPLPPLSLRVHSPPRASCTPAPRGCPVAEFFDASSGVTPSSSSSAAVDHGCCPGDAATATAPARATPPVASRSPTVDGRATRALASVVTSPPPVRELALGSLVFALVCLGLDSPPVLALGPGGPVMEEFWDNVRRYGFYFFTVVSGGLYSLAKPLLDLLKDPSTQILVLIAVIGTIYLMYLTVSTMLGLNEFVYQYAQ